MAKTVIRAEYRTTNSYNEGFICIQDQQIEGIFSLDYVKIDIDANNFSLTLVEPVYEICGHCLKNHLVTTCFIGSPLSTNQLMPFKKYALYTPNDAIVLSLFQIETDKHIVNSVLDELERFRQP